jgi:hypothetical protein
MAYNILKGTVEFTGPNGSLENTVDLKSDQSIDGGKTFNQRLTASAITLGGSTLTHPLITGISSAATNRVTLWSSGTQVSGSQYLTFDNLTLTSSFFSGSGIGLTNLQATEIAGLISAPQIDYGNGIVSSAGVLSVSASHGIAVTATGVSINLSGSSQSGLSFVSGELKVDPTSLTALAPQTLADGDLFIVEDISHGLRKATLTQLMSYITPGLPTAAITTYTNPANNRILTSVNSTSVNSETNLTFDGSTLAVAGAISGSKGLFHVTNGTLQLGSEEVGSGITFKVRSSSDNSIPLLIKTPGHDTILACTGSGQVVVGGLYLAAKLNITGSDTDKLISAKSDSANPAFYVSGSGDAYISGSLRAKQLSYTTHKFSPGSDGLVYLRFDTVGIDSGATNNNKRIAPHNGKLIKVLWRFEGTGTGAVTTTAFSLHKGVAGQQQIQPTPVATVNLSLDFIRDTTYAAAFTPTATFASGDIIGVSLDPEFDPGITVVTCVWEFDENN